MKGIDMQRGLLAVLLAFLPGIAFAGEADVVDVKASYSGAQTYTFNVTVRHADTGWKHYANKSGMSWRRTGPCWGPGRSIIPMLKSSR